MLLSPFSSILAALALAVLAPACTRGGANPAAGAQTDLAPQARLDELAGRMLSYVEGLPVDSLRIPRSLTADGALDARPAADWTSGFFPGVLWQLYADAEPESPELREAAATWTAFVGRQALDSSTHDLGFQIYCSFGEGYEATGEEAYAKTLLTAAATLATRYDERVGAIRSWDWNADEWAFPVIVDNMMNLELLFEATRIGGDSAFHRIADRHAAATLANHFRPDHSSYHVVDYDPATGAVRARVTHQGYGDESAWARGQAWGLYGYAMAYRYTRRPEYLAQARRIAAYFYGHERMPADGVPYWDFDAPAPETGEIPRDASAAAVAASGLLELATYVDDAEEAARYRGWAERSLATLGSDEYRADAPPFLLDHSTGHHPEGSEVDVPIVYADYYYVEALRRAGGMDLQEPR